MPELAFTTNKQQQRASTTFTLDGVEYTARAPKQGAMLRLANAADGEPLEQANAGLAYIFAALDTEGRDLMKSRLDDPDDDLDVEFLLTDILGGLVEEFVERPTTSPSRSTGRRSPTKRRSTGTSASPELTAAG